MSGNHFGTLFQYTSWGESHGPAIGVVIDGVPPGIDLDPDKDIQPLVDLRKTGRSRHVSQRKESDQVQILSGVFEGQTTGTPISVLIWNEDARSKDYSQIKDKFRPGHADYSYQAKYGVRDYRGGGRSSARETVCRVVAGAIARRVLTSQIKNHDIIIKGCVTQIGPHKARDLPLEHWGDIYADDNPFFAADHDIIPVWENFLDKTRKDGNSAGAVLEVHAHGLPAGLGAPVIRKLDADLAAAIMSINAVKSVEIGAGLSAAELSGTENADEMRAGFAQGANPEFASNNAGGILGGISSGQDIIVRFAVKPTSSILQPVATIDKDGQNTEIITKGRHDPCVGVRAVPIAEAMVACVLADHWLMHKAQCL